MTESSRKTSEERREALSQLITSQLSQGWRIESQGDFQAVLLQGHAVNHILHLLITFFTIGLWSIVWIALVLIGGEKRQVVRVDEWGNPAISRL